MTGKGKKRRGTIYRAPTRIHTFWIADNRPRRYAANIQRSDAVTRFYRKQPPVFIQPCTCSWVFAMPSATESDPSTMALHVARHAA